MAAPGSHTFFHKPPVNPNHATLLHCTQISAINFPHCAVAASLGSQPSSSSFLLLLPHPPSRSFPPSPPSLSYAVFLRPRSIPHRHIPSPLHNRTQTAVRIVIGKQISMAVLKVSALMEPAIFDPTKILRRERNRLGSARLNSTRNAERENFCLRKSN